MTMTLTWPMQLFIICLVEICTKVHAEGHFFDRTGFVIVTHPEVGSASLKATQVSKTLEDLRQALVESGIQNPLIVSGEHMLPKLGSWSYFPVFPGLWNLLGSMCDWFVFLNEVSAVNLPNLKEILSKFNSSEEWFVGHGLEDRGNSKAHGYAKGGLNYPDPNGGFALTSGVVHKLAMEVTNSRNVVNEYTVDANYELAKAIVKLAFRTYLHHEEAFCAMKIEDADTKCAIYPRSDHTLSIKPDLLAETLFVVKTWSANHHSRLKILQNTWTRHAKNIVYASDLVDPNFGTTVLPGAERNTFSGHCRKTASILKYFKKASEQKGWRWLVIVDDDTLISPTKLTQLLNLYDSTNEPILIGERFGFKVSGINGRLGYDYPAGGAGMIFNNKLVNQMTNLSQTDCKCPTPDYPDDLFIGLCLKSLDVGMIHSSRLHQYSPSDYNTTLLRRQDPISFHKLDVDDPFMVYNEWLSKTDQEFERLIHCKDDL